jgi:DNA adenine methylase
VVRPLLKWAGGKRQLLHELRRHYPAAFERYFEPFVGSGAVFLDLHNQGLLAGREVSLSDINADVIGVYLAVRDAPEEVIAALTSLERGHAEGGAAHYYEVRDIRFNPARLAVHARREPERHYTPELAAMLVYLNRTGYNGLFRLNARGGFNVPAGRYSRVRICDAANIRAFSAAVSRPGLRLTAGPFRETLAGAGRRDFVYLDPPYAPVSRTSAFTSYTAGGFGPEEQAALQGTVIELSARGAHVLLSNSVAAEIRRLYADHDGARAAGLQARRVRARRAINSRATARGPVFEYLITNVPARRSSPHHRVS